MRFMSIGCSLILVVACEGEPDATLGQMSPPGQLNVQHSNLVLPGGTARFDVQGTIAQGEELLFVSGLRMGPGRCVPGRGFCLSVVGALSVLHTYTPHGWEPYVPGIGLQAEVSVDVPDTAVPGTELWIEPVVIRGIGGRSSLSASPIRVVLAYPDPSPRSFLHVDHGNLFSCGIDSVTRQVECWGSSSNAASAPPAVPATHADVRQNHGCLVSLVDGSVDCWGANSSGQSAPPAGAFSEVTVGDDTSCGLRTDGTLDCWGSNRIGLASPPSGVFRSVDMGSQNGCAIRESDAGLECWGQSIHGLLSEPSGAFEQVTVGTGHACAIRDTGEVACWGFNGQQQTQAPSGEFLAIAAHHYTCGVRTDGHLTCWGDGDGPNGEPMPTDAGYVDVTAGLRNACATKEDGTLRCWGSNTYQALHVPR